MVRSVEGLSSTAFALVQDMLNLHSQFNLMQFLQGESAPSNMASLQRIKEETPGVALFDAYFLTLLGVFSGLAGHTDFDGSAFFNESKARQFVFALKALRHL